MVADVACVSGVGPGHAGGVHPERGGGGGRHARLLEVRARGRQDSAGTGRLTDRQTRFKLAGAD